MASSEGGKHARAGGSGSSSSSSAGLAGGNPEAGRNASIRRPTYWLEMKGIKPATNKPAERKAGGSLSKAKHRLEQEGEDNEEFPRKKQKVPGKQQQVGRQPRLKPKGRHVQKDPPAYAAGSLEEQWYLEILEKGRVTCPTCRAVVRKTVKGLKKHMANCQEEMLTCHHCGKQLRSLAGMKYHVMADHNSMPLAKERSKLDEQSERDRLRKVLKRMGKLKCTREGCTGSFTSLMGYLYHAQKCGKAAAELEKMALKCHHCGKAYKSKAGLAYHLKSEHGPASSRGSWHPGSAKKWPLLFARSAGAGGLSLEHVLAARQGRGAIGLGRGRGCKAWPCRQTPGTVVPDWLLAPRVSVSGWWKQAVNGSIVGSSYQAPFLHEESRPGRLKDASTEPNSGAGGGESSGGGRVQRKSAKVAAYYLHELANEELVKEWPKRKVLQDLVPDDRKLKYTRPGLPAVSQEVLCKWRSEIKVHRRVHCPNQGCECVYSSISGLKSHLGSCTLGEFVAGKYRCLLCEKEFVSESGVKYHINTVHAEDWFDTDTNTTKSFAKLMKLQQREAEGRRPRKKPPSSRGRKRRPRTVSPRKPPRAGPEPSRRRRQQQRVKAGRSQAGDSESRSSEEEDDPQPLKLNPRRGRK